MTTCVVTVWAQFCPGLNNKDWQLRKLNKLPQMCKHAAMLV